MKQFLCIVFFFQSIIYSMEAIDEWQHDAQDEPIETTFNDFKNLNKELSQIESTAQEFKAVSKKIVSDDAFFRKLKDMCTSLQHSIAHNSPDYIGKFCKSKTTLNSLQILSENQDPDSPSKKKIEKKVKVYEAKEIEISRKQLHLESIQDFYRIACKLRTDLNLPIEFSDEDESN